jgi:hypothetical protein
MGNYAWLAILYQFALIINETDMGGGQSVFERLRQNYLPGMTSTGELHPPLNQRERSQRCGD